LGLAKPESLIVEVAVSFEKGLPLKGDDLRRKLPKTTALCERTKSLGF